MENFKTASCIDKIGGLKKFPCDKKYHVKIPQNVKIIFIYFLGIYSENNRPYHIDSIDLLMLMCFLKS